MRRTINTKSILLLIGLMTYCILASAQKFDWVQNIGGKASEMCQDVAVDGNGNVYITGFFGSDTAYLGTDGNMLRTSGGNDVFLAKYDAAGKLLWAKSMGGDGNDLGQAVTVDGDGNVYVAGHFTSGTAYFNRGGTGGELRAISGFDVFLAKYDANGNYLWAKSMGGPGADQCLSVAVDSSYNVYITGQFNSAVAEFNPGNTTGRLTPVGGLDVYLAKYDSSGTYLWANSMGGKNADYGYEVTVDHGGNVYVTGYFSSDTARFDPTGNKGTLTNSGPYDMEAYLAKYDANGNLLWANSMGGNGIDYFYDAATDQNGNVYVTGYSTSDTAYLNPASNKDILISKGNEDIILAKYDGSGNYLWAKNMGGSGTDYGYDVAIDRSGNVYVGGEFRSSTAYFNPGSSSNGTQTNMGGYDVFLAKYDPDGNYLWSKAMGGNSDDNGRGVAVDGSGNVYEAGYFYSDPADFNIGGSNGKLVNAGFYDTYVVKFVCSDTSSSHQTISTCEASYTLGDSVYTVEGTYTQMFPNTAGCDSMVTFDLTFYELDPVINIDSFTLGVTGSFATYQWIKDGKLIPGATDSTYTVSENGDYQVIVTNGKGCSDTSEVYLVRNTGLTDASTMTKHIKVYPNPTNDKVYIQTPIEVTVALTSITGKVIRRVEDAGYLSVKDLAAGLYLLQIMDSDGALIKVEKVVKQK